MYFKAQTQRSNSNDASVIAEQSEGSQVISAEREESNQRCFARLNMTKIGSRELANAPSLNVVYFELVLRVVVEMRSSDTSFGLPMASTSLPV